MLTLKMLTGCLCVAAALAGLFWTIRLYLMGMYGVPFSWWYPILLLGSLSLLVGGCLSWLPSRGWADWLPLFGSVVLVAYFVPAMIETLRAYFMGEVVGGAQLVGRLFSVALVLASLVVSVVGRLQSRK